MRFKCYETWQYFAMHLSTYCVGFKSSQSDCPYHDIVYTFHNSTGYGSSGDPCDNIYSGSHPFSERETLSLARHLYKLRRRIVSYMDVHVFGQLWMSPWGFTGNTPKHAAQHESMLKAIKTALLKERDIMYDVGQSATVLCKYITNFNSNLNYAFG